MTSQYTYVDNYNIDTFLDFNIAKSLIMPLKTNARSIYMPYFISQLIVVISDQTPVACPPLGVPAYASRSAAPKKCICLYIHIAITMITRQSVHPAHRVASVRYHKGWLSPARSLVISLIIPSPAGVKSKSTLVTGSRAYPS